MEKVNLEVPFGEITLEFDYKNKSVWFHAKAECWNVKVYKESLDAWNTILNFCKTRGFKYVASYIPDNNKIRKFQTLFGLEPYGQTEKGLIFRMEI